MLFRPKETWPVYARDKRPTSVVRGFAVLVFSRALPVSQPGLLDRMASLSPCRQPHPQHPLIRSPRLAEAGSPRSCCPAAPSRTRASPWPTNGPSGPYETVAGFVMDRLGRLPHAGDQAEISGHVLTVTAMDRRRIARIRVAPLNGTS